MPIQFLTNDARILFAFLALNPEAELLPEALASLLYPFSDNPLAQLIEAQENLWEAFPLALRLFRGLTIQDSITLNVPVRIAPQPPIITVSVDIFNLIEALESGWEDRARPEIAALLTEAAVAIGKGMVPGFSGAWLDSWREQLCSLYRDATVRFMAADPELCLQIRAQRPFSAVKRGDTDEVKAPFYGRAEELDELCKLLGRGERVLSLVGLGGAGKTRLALELLGSLPGELQYWPRASVSLSGVSTRGALLEALRNGLGLQTGDILQDGRDPLGTICRGLQEPAILFLDNAEDAVRNSDSEVVQTLSYLIYRCPQVILISTSRCRIGLPEEYVFTVEGLPVPAEDDFIQLDVTALEERYPGLGMLSHSYQALSGTALDLRGEQAGAILALLRQSGGLPLSIELLASRISKQRASLPALDEIKRSAGWPQRAVDWALEPLSASTRVFLERLGIFEGAFNREDAREVTGEQDVEFRLTELDDAGLVSSVRSDDLGSYHYHLPSAVRDSVREDLGNSPDYFLLRKRHTDYFAQLAEKGNVGLRGAERVVWLPRLRLASQDIIAVIRGNLTSDSHIEFAARVFSDLAHYFVASSQPHVGMDLAKQVLKRSQNMGGLPELLEIEVIDSLGKLQTQAGLFVEAERNLKIAFPYWQSNDNEREVARCANNLAVCCDQQGRFDEAKEYFDIAWRGFYRIGERRACAQILQNMAFALKKYDQWQEAYDLLKDACTIITEEFPTEPLTAKFLFDYAEVLYVLHKDEEAIEVNKRILSILEIGVDTLRIANTMLLTGLSLKRMTKFSHIDCRSYILCGWSISQGIISKSDFTTSIQSEISSLISTMRLKEIPVFSELDLRKLRDSIFTL